MSVPGVAEAYDHHVGRYGAQLAAGLIDVAGVRRGQKADLRRLQQAPLDLAEMPASEPATPR